MSKHFPQASPPLSDQRVPRRLQGSQVDHYNDELPSWGPPDPARTWQRFVYANSTHRGDAVGAFLRMARSDPEFPTDPTEILRHLARNLAPSETLAVAREAIAEFRRWADDGLEALLRGVEERSPGSRIRESISESRDALARLYAEDDRLGGDLDGGLPETAARRGWRRGLQRAAWKSS